jgi:hypothetical protein
LERGAGSDVLRRQKTEANHSEHEYEESLPVIVFHRLSGRYYGEQTSGVKKKGERSGLLMRIAVTESVSLCGRIKS